MGWFGPSEDEVWRQLSQEIGAEFVESGLWTGSKVQAHVGPWIVILDEGRSDQDGKSLVTRLRAPYVHPEGFRFTIYRKGVFSELGKLLGMQDIEVGDPDFDAAFIINGSDEFRVRDLFADAQIRKRFQAQPEIRLDVKDSEGWFGPKFPDDVDELNLQVVGVIKVVEWLKALFDLFAAVLDQLCRIGSACKREPGITL
jgi:hypothetical protein